MLQILTRRPLLSLLLWLVIVFATAAVGAIASANAPSFYAELDRPAWAPPAAVFGPVWTVLYALMAVAVWRISQVRGDERRVRTALILFSLQLLANGLWSWLFFAWRLGAIATVEIVVLWVLIALTMLSFWRLRPWTGMLLVPYLLWVSYATALTISLWTRNPALLG